MKFPDLMRKHALFAVLLVAAGLSTGCASASVPRRSEEDAVRRAIEEEIARGVEATRTENIDAYMERIPEGLVIHDESGEVISRQQLRENALRDWGIIVRTLDIRVDVDRLKVRGDTAIVHTSQRWERLMLQKDGVTQDTVLTTQRHRETWRRTPRGWRAYEIEELGGEVYINGKPYHGGH